MQIPADAATTFIAGELTWQNLSLINSDASFVTHGTDHLRTGGRNM